MIFAIPTVSMYVCMNMRMLVSMNHISMTMFVDVRMFMFMSMLQFNRIFYLFTYTNLCKMINNF